ncbi:MAG: hypothetical protein JO219_09715 [Candidatus Eremiobacteraeota bacterium]|nr:hypothetical protein [Candidatus Eremiobacteraeota bacterium]MBV8366353.1 hypothetical protein [Candidatus Eremiobacteraeota bacterium]
MRRTDGVAVLAVSLAVLAALTGCTNGALSMTPAPNVVDPSSFKMQLAVGTATIAVKGGGAFLGLNTVATFRQTNGNNATSINTPTLTGPPGLDFTLGSANVMAGYTPSALFALLQQTGVPPPPPGLDANASFGVTTGVFGYGFSASNAYSVPVFTQLRSLTGLAGYCIGFVPLGLNTNGVFYNAPDATQKSTGNLGLPLLTGGITTCKGQSSQGPFASDSSFPYTYIGGPPLYPSPQGYRNPVLFSGYSLGFADIAVTPVAGTYTISAIFPNSVNYSSYAKASAAAQLSSLAALPIFPQPAVTVNADGSGVVAVNVPAGVTESVITISAFDCDLVDTNRGFGTFDYYSVYSASSGSQVLFLSSNLGPPQSSGTPSHTFCTKDDVNAYNQMVAIPNGLPQLTSYNQTVYVAAVGFDYPAVEASYPFNLTQAPTIANSAGQADITTSYPFSFTNNVVVP